LIHGALSSTRYDYVPERSESHLLICAHQVNLTLEDPSLIFCICFSPRESNSTIVLSSVLQDRTDGIMMFGYLRNRRNRVAAGAALGPS
jgi:hypothetical protein